LRFLQRSAKEPPSQLWPLYRLLAQHLAEALSTTPEGVSFINNDAALPENTVRQAEREEAFHRAMLRATDGNGLEEAHAAAFLQSTDALRAAAEIVRQTRPYVGNNSEVAEELAARLALGEWDKLKLTAAEAGDAWTRFADLVASQYKQGREILNYGPGTEVHGHQADAGNRARQTDDRVAGQKHAPRGTEGKGPRYRFAVQQPPAPNFAPTPRPRTATQHAPQTVKAGSPLIDSAVELWQSTRDDLRKNLNAYALAPDANTAGLSLREHAARSAQSFARAEKALDAARKLFATRTWDENLNFINRMEVGDPQPDLALQAIADTMRQLLDSHRIAVQKLGKNKLTTFYENYFPHLWKRGKEAESIFRAIFGKRPIEGTKAFLQQRKFKSFQEGVDAHLVPVSENPVDLVLLKPRRRGRRFANVRLTCHRGR
jgi:hypothetical protein